MSPDDAKEWADAGLEQLLGDLKDFELPLKPEEAATFMRAAYGKGYRDGLTDPAPIVRDALQRSAILNVLVPVS